MRKVFPLSVDKGLWLWARDTRTDHAITCMAMEFPFCLCMKNYLFEMKKKSKIDEKNTE